MKKRELLLGIVLVSFLLLSLYFVFSQPLDVTPSSITHSFNNPGADGLDSNFTWVGRNATINFTITIPDYSANSPENITQISFNLPNNIIMDDFGNASNGTALNTSVGDDWYCEADALTHTYMNWTCNNATASQLGANDLVFVWFNITANSTATGPITWQVTIVGNSSDQDANTTEYSIMAAQPTFVVESDINQFNVTVGSNSAYTLRANISNVFGAEINNTIITWYLPYGMINNSVCNGTNGFWTVNSTTVACDQNIGNFTPSYSTWANETITLEVNDTIGAFSDYYEFSGITISESFWVTVNCTETDNAFGCEQNSTVLSESYGINHWKNPRPYAINDSSTENITLRFDNWAQARNRYEVWVPLMTYNSSSMRPEPSENDSWADIVYADKAFIENPEYFELWGYRLNFTFYNDSASTDNITFHIYTPSYEFENQTLQPLLIRNETKTYRDGTTGSQIVAAPAQAGFNVWYNSTELTDTTLTSSFGINVTYNSAHGRNGDNKLLTVVSVPEYENVSLSVLFTLMSNASASSGRSPIHVLMQDVGGFNPEEAPPVLNGSIDMKFRIDIENALQNFTLDGLSVHLLNPINLTNENTGDSFNMSEGAVISWLYPGNDTWIDNENIVEKEATFGMDDNVSGSPCFGQNMSIYFKTYDIDLNHSYFNSWDPGSGASNVSVNLTATIRFPIANFTDDTPDTAGSFNEYNMSMSMSRRGALNLTDILSGVGTDVNSTINVYIDGTLLTNSDNFTVGSLQVNDVDQGTHTVSVSYTRASAAATASAGGGAAAQGGYAPLDVSKGIVRTMSIEDAVVVSLGELGGGSAGGKAGHQIVLDRMDSNSVNLLIYSTPIRVVLKVGESKKVDVDADGILDILIKLNSIDVPHQKADIYFEDITPKKEAAPPSGIEEVEEEEIVEEKPVVPTGEAVAPEEVPTSKAWIWVLVVLVMVALVVVYFITKKKGYDTISFEESKVSPAKKK